MTKKEKKEKKNKAIIALAGSWQSLAGARSSTRPIGYTGWFSGSSNSRRVSERLDAMHEAIQTRTGLDWWDLAVKKSAKTVIVL